MELYRWNLISRTDLSDNYLILAGREKGTGNHINAKKIRLLRKGRSELLFSDEAQTFICQYENFFFEIADWRILKKQFNMITTKTASQKIIKELKIEYKKHHGKSIDNYPITKTPDFSYIKISEPVKYVIIDIDSKK